MEKDSVELVRVAGQLQHRASFLKQPWSRVRRSLFCIRRHCGREKSIETFPTFATRAHQAFLSQYRQTSWEWAISRSPQTMLRSMSSSLGRDQQGTWLAWHSLDTEWAFDWLTSALSAFRVVMLEVGFRSPIIASFLPSIFFGREELRLDEVAISHICTAPLYRETTFPSTLACRRNALLYARKLKAWRLQGYNLEHRKFSRHWACDTTSTPKAIMSARRHFGHSTPKQSWKERMLDPRSSMQHPTHGS